MKIRHADSAQDATGCAAIYAPFVEETAVSLEVRVPTAADVAARISRIEQTHPWLVAEDGDRLTGFAYASPHRERAGYRWAADVTVYVDPASHRQGIGRALYSCLLGLLYRQGLWIACAGIGLPNDASVSLHESLGFLPVGVYRNIGYKLGRWWDVGWWQLSLRQPGEEHPGEPGPPVRLESKQSSPRPGV
ncbi:MAG TPA: GNAT family N-acetyltransferase [Solirubrobacteraceae bacterium]|jgi:phosphinothricin acetyltransferase